MRILFALPGLHRLDRGAEIAFMSIASVLAKAGESVTLIGSGHSRPGAPYRFLHAGSITRDKFQRFPALPALRNDCAYEELTFVPALMRAYDPADFDVTVTCSYPYTNWVLRRPTGRGSRPPHVFVTQNGDWPAFAQNSEYRMFGCEGLVCTNGQYYERQKDRWRCRLIPNGVDCDRFVLGPGSREQLDLPSDRLLVLMVSALIPSKRVASGIEAVSRLPDAYLLVVGDGPLRQEIQTMADRLMPGRFKRVSVAPENMPMVYRSADVFLHMSKIEPSSLAFLEALASGLPIVAHELERLRVIAGDDAFLLDTDDIPAVARALQAAAPSTAEQRERRANKAEKYSWQRIGAMYREFLAEVVALR
jgi:glycosyltransferase involved in cell wall biosynthesis